MVNTAINQIIAGTQLEYLGSFRKGGAMDSTVLRDVFEEIGEKIIILRNLLIHLGVNIQSLFPAIHTDIEQLKTTFKPWYCLSSIWHCNH